MATKMIRQTIFTAGEADVNIWKRTDIKGYLTAAQSLRNMEVGTTGLARKRSGSLRLVDVTSIYTQNSEFYEFLDKNNNYYLVISSNLVFNFYLVNQDTTLTFVTSVVTPYTATDLYDLDFSLDNDTLVLSHSKYPPSRIYISAYNANPLMNTFSFENINIQNYPCYDFGNINYNTYTIALSGNGNVGSTLTVTVTNNPSGTPLPTGFTQDYISGQIIGIGSSADQPVGYANIISINTTNPNSTVFTATVIQAFGNVPGTSIGSQFVFKKPAWSNTLGWPANVLFYQNRLWFASTRTLPGTIFGSRINQPTNFDVGIGNDADAIIYNIGQSDSGPILWLNGGKQFEIYTTNYEFAAPQEQNLGLTPSTFSIRQQSAYGSSALIKPITYINDSYYIGKTGNSLNNFHFDGIGQTYTSTNISVQATHLIKNPTNRSLVRGTESSQDNFIYFLNSDYTVTAFQFAAEYKLAAFTPLVFDGRRIDPNNPANVLNDPVKVFDLCTVNNNIYFLKQYIDYSGNTPILITEDFNVIITEDGNILTLENGENYKYFIEVFNPDEFLDAQSSSSMDIFGNVSSLDSYDGYYVQVLYNGQDYGEYLVSNGAIIVDNPEQYTGNISLGLLYDVELTPMYLFSGENSSNYFKKISRIYVDYYNSLNFYINGKLVTYQNFNNIQNNVPLSPQTDTAIINAGLAWSRFNTFSITQSSPFDLQITAIAYQIEDHII